jgi:hypothetical protein
MLLTVQYGTHNEEGAIYESPFVVLQVERLIRASTSDHTATHIDESLRLCALEDVV